jgi:two-component system chemotaxis response regulator CheB
MDGITALKEIRKFNPFLPIIIFSTHTQRGAAVTIDALTNGASDYAPKPSNMTDIDESLTVIENTLMPKIRSLVSKESVPDIASPEKALITTLPDQHQKVGALCIGISTGGPSALMQLFQEITAPLSVPIFIVQHMPPKFTELLAKRLSEVGSTLIEEPYDGQEPIPGNGYIAPGGMHMEVNLFNGKPVINLTDKPPENSCRPAVDVLFRTAAKVYGNQLLAIVMTGMGSDGVKGAGDIIENKGTVLAQDEGSSVVWGMPGAVVKANLASKVIPLNSIAKELQNRIAAK